MRAVLFSCDSFRKRGHVLMDIYCREKVGVVTVKVHFYMYVHGNEVSKFGSATMENAKICFEIVF